MDQKGKEVRDPAREEFFRLCAKEGYYPSQKGAMSDLPIEQVVHMPGIHIEAVYGNVQCREIWQKYQSATLWQDSGESRERARENGRELEEKEKGETNAQKNLKKFTESEIKEKRQAERKEASQPEKTEYNQTRIATTGKARLQRRDRETAPTKQMTDYRECSMCGEKNKSRKNTADDISAKVEKAGRRQQSAGFAAGERTNAKEAGQAANENSAGMERCGGHESGINPLISTPPVERKAFFALYHRDKDGPALMTMPVREWFELYEEWRITAKQSEALHDGCQSCRYWRELGSGMDVYACHYLLDKGHSRASTQAPCEKRKIRREK